VATDGDGNPYIVGLTGGDLDDQPNAGGFDAYVASFDAAGVEQWARLLGTTESDQPRAVAVDDAGRIYVGGNTRGDLDGHINAGNEDAFIAQVCPP
jgi:hypothetical protein